MKNLFFLVLALFFCLTELFAQMRTESEAFVIAQSFIKSENENLKNDHASLDLVYSPSMIDQQSLLTDKVYYYVYNVGNNNGFIIISGDERAKQVLGYSEEGRFDIKEISDNLKYWLSCYEEELDLLAILPQEEITLVPELKSSTEIMSEFASSIQPLVKAKWNQGAPYNYDCPVIPSTGNRAAVGCTAVASAQIMHYHRWPKTGSGSLTQVIFNKSYKVDFSQTTYEWDKMLDFYQTSASQNDETVKAVSLFLYHVGFAAKTDYGPESGAYTKDMAQALMNYFGYDKNMQVYKRDYFSKAEWEDLIKKELNASRPIHYAGYSSELTGGHAFVCDGYDENGLFHFNWGWGSYANGYFELSALNPGSLGIGSGSGNYNRNQEIIAGIQPPTSSATTNYQLHLKNISLLSSPNISKSDAVTVKANSLFNFGLSTFSGQIGLCLFNEEGTAQRFGTRSVNNLLGNTGWDQISFSGTIPSTVAAGNYKMYFVYKENSESEWTILKGKSGLVNYLNVQITSQNVKFSVPAEIMPKLEIVNEGIQEIYQGTSAHIKLTLKNSGGGEYNSFISVAFDLSRQNIFMSKTPVVISAGETKQLLISGNTSGLIGNHDLYVFFDTENDFSDNLAGIVNENDPVKINVVSSVSKSINLTLSSGISFPDKTNVTPNTFDLMLKIKNTGDNYDGRVYAAIANSSGVYSSFDSQQIVLSKNEDITLHFNNPPDVNYGTLNIGVFYFDPLTSSTKWFSPTNNCITTIEYKADPIATGIDSVSPTVGSVNIYPNPVEDVLFVTSEIPVLSVSIYDLSGMKILEYNFDGEENISLPVNHLEKGLYVIRLGMEDNNSVMKFQKK